MGKAERNKRQKSKQKDKVPEGTSGSVPNSPDAKKKRTRSGSRPEDLVDGLAVQTGKRKIQKSTEFNEGEQPSTKDNSSIEHVNNNATPTEGETKESRAVNAVADESRATQPVESSAVDAAGETTVIDKTPKNPITDGNVAQSSEAKGQVEDLEGVKLRVETEEDDFIASDSDSSSSQSSSTGSSTESESDDYRRSKRKKRAKYSRKRRAEDPSPRRGKKFKKHSSGHKSSAPRSSLLEQNPEIWQIVDQLVDRCLAEREKQEKGGKPQKHLRDRATSLDKQLKSPSDTTLYTPALKKLTRPVGQINHHTPTSQDRVIEAIRSIRLQTQLDHLSEERSRSATPDKEREKTPRERARSEAQEAILDAERFKASATVLPKGKTDTYDYNKDGEFLSVTCHVETSVLERMKAGEFVDLEKILAKAVASQKKFNSESKVELINTEGQSFSLTTSTPDRDCKITNVRKWEKAFRIYAMVYSEANPTRAPEIMQYIDDIHSAAATFVWENVAVYDYMFRRLMAKHPNRSWGVTNTHMWTMYLKDHIPARGASFGSPATSASKQNWRDVACWRYNKNKCNKSAAECRFEHRCSFCGSFSHIYYGCPKKPNKRGDKKSKDNKKPAEATSGASAPADQQ